MPTFEPTLAVFLLAGFALLIYGAVRFHEFTVRFIRRAEEDVRKREAHAYEVEGRMLSLMEQLVVEGQGRTMSALEKLAHPSAVASSRAQSNQANLNSTLQVVSDTLRNPLGSRGSVRPLHSIPGVPTFPDPEPEQ